MKNPIPDTIILHNIINEIRRDCYFGALSRLSEDVVLWGMFLNELGEENQFKWRTKEAVGI